MFVPFPFCLLCFPPPSFTPAVYFLFLFLNLFHLPSFLSPSVFSSLFLSASLYSSIFSSFPSFWLSPFPLSSLLPLDTSDISSSSCFTSICPPTFSLLSYFNPSFPHFLLLSWVPLYTSSFLSFFFLSLSLSSDYCYLYSSFPSYHIPLFVLPFHCPCTLYLFFFFTLLSISPSFHFSFLFALSLSVYSPPPPLSLSR